MRVRLTTPVSIVHALRGRAHSRLDGKTALERLAHEQAALRRVATLVAKEAPPGEVFAKVAEEAMDVLGTQGCGLLRDEGDGNALVVAAWGTAITNSFPVGTRVRLAGDSVTGVVVRERRSHRIDDYTTAPAEIAEGARRQGVRSAVGCPIVVGDEIWGAMVVATSGDTPCPPDTEQRLAQFADLAATAVANAQARAEVGRLADEQAALRGVAVLVAQHPSPEEVFTAVTEAVGPLLGADLAAMHVFTVDGTATAVAGWSAEGPIVPLGTLLPLDGDSAVARIFDTGSAARIDSYEDVEGETADVARGLRLRSTVGAPIVVEGRLWGALMAATRGEKPLPQDAESRIAAFTELVATAVANAESREALARLVDEQAALRRVATLVASGVEPGPLFDAIAGEIEALFGVDISAVVRFEDDGTVTVMGAHGGPHNQGARVQLDPDYIVSAVYRTRQAARFDVEDWEGEPPGVVQEMGMRSALATPIVVEGELWGAITIASLAGTLVAATERRLADFSALFATAIANTHAREQVTALVEEQAALRRVATLAARELAPVEVLVAVTEEAARALQTEAAGLLRFDDDGSATLVAQSQTPWDPPPLGTRFTLDGENIVAWVHRTGRAARMDDWANATGAVSAMAHVLGVRSAVATPIVVEGRLWGTMIAATSQSKPLPADIESRIGEFTELAATAIANAESREALGLLVDEQAALQRVATLVAQGVPAPELFSAVTKEVEHVFSGIEPSVLASVIRFDPGPECVLVGASRPYEQEAIGARWAPKDLYVSTRVLRTGGSARVDEADLEAFDGPDADVLRLRGFLHQIGSPVVVEGRLWGAMTLNSKEALPPDVDQRLVSFTELVATAIANAESQSELAASRRRVVAASDDARRRIERDLHDGIQQQLVSLGMELGELEASLPADGDLKPQVAGVTSGLRGAIDDLREISRGIHPAILSHGGLGAALKTLARRSSVPVQLSATIDGRLPERVEVAAYYVVSEALTNAARHARASVVSIDVVELDGGLELSIRDDGVGGADPVRGTGLIGLKDRVEALDGEISVESPPGHGTSLVVSFPLGGEREGEVES